jgi:hypothetical protein
MESQYTTSDGSDDDGSWELEDITDGANDNNNTNNEEEVLAKLVARMAVVETKLKGKKKDFLTI